MQGWQLFTGRVPTPFPPPIIRLLETHWDEHLNISLNSTKLVMAYLYSEVDGINFPLQNNNKYSATCISSEKEEEKWCRPLKGSGSELMASFQQLEH